MFRALFSETGEIVAVKQIIFEADDDLEDIVNEVRILRKCDNDNIIRYYGSYIDKSDNSLWIAMELCEYGSISDLMSKAGRTLNEQECVFVLKGMLHGLSYLHKEKVLHRDIKGNNVLVGADGQVRLADFGVSAQATMSGRSTVIGTPYWMAPEVIRGLQYNTPADIWSCGITAIELMTGLPPLAELHPMRAMFLIPSSKPPVLTDKVKHSEALDELIAMMLKKDPKQRATVDALLSKIEEYPIPITGLESLLEEAEKRKSQMEEEAKKKKDDSTIKIFDDDSSEGASPKSSGTCVPGDGIFGGMGTCVPMGTCIVNDNCTSVFNDTSYFTLSSSNPVELGSLASTIMRGTIVKQPVNNDTVVFKNSAETCSETGPSIVGGKEKKITIEDLSMPTEEELKLMDVPALQSAKKKLRKLLKVYKNELEKRQSAFNTISSLM